MKWVTAGDGLSADFSYWVNSLSCRETLRLTRHHPSPYILPIVNLLIYLYFCSLYTLWGSGYKNLQNMTDDP
jgi:hypothetical protein